MEGNFTGDIVNAIFFMSVEHNDNPAVFCGLHYLI
jgi:hypothetical protein